MSSPHAPHPESGPASNGPRSPRPPSRRGAVGRLLLLAIVIAIVALVAWRLGLFQLRDRERLLAVVDELRGARLLAPAFVLAYAAAVTFGLPASAFTLAGGVLFGFWRGLLFNWLGATAGAMLAYLFADLLCRGDCRRLLGRRGSALERVAADHGFMSMLRLRLIPVVPFSLLNFAAALAGVRRRDYALATALGIVPGAAVYTYFADSLLQGAAGAERHALTRLTIAAGLLLLLSFTPAIIRRAREG